MNKLFITLVGTSLAALLLAVGCGSWLFLQSWEEGKRLERQNRELMASLEASRIRLENFCEYPTDALCNLDTQNGSVSSAMSGLTPTALQTPESSPVPTPRAVPLSEPTPRAKAMSTPAETSSPETSRAEEVTSSVATEKAQANAVPLQPTDKPKQAEATAPATTAERVASKVSAPARPKKTWTSLDQDKNAMTLRIAGEGSSLTASGQILPDPLRYEVTLQGLWNVSNRDLETTLVKGMNQNVRKGDTVLVFSLAETPGDCAVRQEDPRTIAIVIR